MIGLTVTLSPNEIEEYRAKIIPAGNVLMSCVGRFGLTSINKVDVTCNQQVHGFIVMADTSSEYLSIVIKVASKQLAEMASSTTIAYLNKSKCESIQFGLPPLKEQHRIVAKVNELITLCERLSAGINVAQIIRLQLANVMVEQADLQSKVCN